MGGFGSDYSQGGWPMIAILLFGAIGAVGGLAAFIVGAALKQRSSWLPATLIVLSLIAPTIGVIDYPLQTKSVNEIFSQPLPPEADVPRLRAAAQEEAKKGVYYGSAAGVLPFCFGLGLLVIRSRASSST